MTTAVLVLTGCETDDRAEPVPSSPSPSRSLVPTVDGPELVIATEREASGLDGGVGGSVVEVDGCLGLQGEGEAGVLSLPPGTEPIEGGARLPDGTELVVGDEDVLIGGMWLGPGDTGYPEDDYDCLGGSVVLVFVPESLG